jgi:hypothetical protein
MDSDLIAAFCPVLNERVSKAVGHRLDLRIGQPLIATDQGDLVW